jgi:hypothetical protein
MVDKNDPSQNESQNTIVSSSSSWTSAGFTVAPWQSSRGVVEKRFEGISRFFSSWHAFSPRTGREPQGKKYCSSKITGAAADRNPCNHGFDSRPRLFLSGYLIDTYSFCLNLNDVIRTLTDMVPFSALRTLPGIHLSLPVGNGMFCNQSLSRLSFCGGRDHGVDAPIGGDKLRLGISRRLGFPAY